VQHLGVADAPEQVRQPLQLVTQPPHPFLVQQRREGPKRGAQPADAHPRLVDGLGILAQPHARLVTKQPHSGGGQVIAQQLLDRGILVQVADLQLGWPDLAVAERAPVLAELLDRLARPRLLQAGQDLVHGVRPDAVAQLDLELAEPVDHPPVLDHLHLVVDDLGQALAGGVAQLDRLPNRPQPGDRLQRRATDVDPQQRGGLLRHLAWLAVEGLLLPHQHPGGVLSLCGCFTVQPSSSR
jgi:hypothetical protein